MMRDAVEATFGLVSFLFAKANLLQSYWGWAEGGSDELQTHLQGSAASALRGADADRVTSRDTDDALGQRRLPSRPH